MESIQQVKERFQKLKSYELLRLVNDKNRKFSAEVFEVLKEELKRRGEENAVSILEKNKDQLIENNSSEFKDLSFDEIKQLISERLSTGESIDSIKLDLTDNGIEIQDYIDADLIQKELMYEQIASLREEGVESNDIANQIGDDYNLESKEVEDVFQQMNSRGKFYKILGSVLLLAGFSLSILGIALLERFPIKLVVISILSGGYLLNKGTRQTKNG